MRRQQQSNLVSQAKQECMVLWKVAHSWVRFNLNRPPPLKMKWNRLARLESWWISFEHRWVRRELGLTYQICILWLRDLHLGLTYRFALFSGSLRDLWKCKLTKPHSTDHSQALKTWSVKFSFIPPGSLRWKGNRRCLGWWWCFIILQEWHVSQITFGPFQVSGIWLSQSRIAWWTSSGLLDTRLSITGIMLSSLRQSITWPLST